MESEGSWRQNAALMNKNRIRRGVEDKWAYDYEIQYPYRNYARRYGRDKRESSTNMREKLLFDN